MNKRKETMDWHNKRQSSTHLTERDRELKAALDQSISDLAARYDAILNRDKKTDQIDHSA